MMIFAARSTGYIFGYILGGAMFDKIDSNLTKRWVICLMEILCAGAAFGVPFCQGIYPLSAIFFAGGLTIGVLETSFNTLILHMWGRKGNPYFMALNFLIGVGGLLGVILQRIFVQDLSAIQAISKKTLHLVPGDIFKPDVFPHMMYSYLILCVIIVFVSLLWFLSLFCPFEDLLRGGTFLTEGDLKIPTKEFTVFAVMTAALLTFHCGTISLGYQDMLAIYTLEGHSMSTKSMLDIASFFWGFYTLGGFLAIFAAKVCHPFIMIIICLLLEVAAGIVLILLSISNNDMLALGNALLGLGAGALFGWTVLWVDRYIATTYKIIAALLMAQCLAELIVPPVLAFALTKNTHSLSYFSTYSPIAYFIIFLCQCLWFFPHGEKYISISSLPRKVNKQRWFPIWLEKKRKRSDPRLVEEAIHSSGIDLQKPFMVTQRESPVQTIASSTIFWEPKKTETKESGVQVKVLSREEVRNSLKIAKESLRMEKQKKAIAKAVEEDHESDSSEEPEKPAQKKSSRLAIFGNIFGKTEKKPEQDDESEEESDEAEKPVEKRSSVIERIFGKSEEKVDEDKSESEEDKIEEEPKQKDKKAKKESKIEEPKRESKPSKETKEGEEEPEEVKSRKSLKEDKSKESDETKKADQKRSTLIQRIFGKSEEKVPEEEESEESDESEKPEDIDEKPKEEDKPKLEEEPKRESKPKKSKEEKLPEREDESIKSQEETDKSDEPTKKPEKPKPADSGKLSGSTRRKSSWYYANIMH